MYSELPTLRIAPHMAILGWGFVRVIITYNILDLDSHISPGLELCPLDGGWSHIRSNDLWSAIGTGVIVIVIVIVIAIGTGVSKMITLMCFSEIGIFRFVGGRCTS